MTHCTDIIHQLVTEHIRNGTIIDVYQMAASVQESYPGLSVNGIAQHITAAVAVHHGNAVWDPDKKPKPSG